MAIASAVRSSQFHTLEMGWCHSRRQPRDLDPQSRKTIFLSVGRFYIEVRQAYLAKPYSGA